MRRLAIVALGGTLLGGCYRGSPGAGESATDSGGTDTDATGPAEPPPEAGGVGMVGLRRLSRSEMDNTLRDLLGDDTRPGTTFLPEDVIDPFDNDFTNQAVSTVLVESIETLANDVAVRLAADPTRRDMVVGCTPSGAADATCMESFVATFGQQALRRPLLDEEVSDWSALGLDFAGQRNDFYEGVDVVLRLLLQHPNFVYRVELGAETLESGVFRLNQYELATRLAYFVWGSTPNDQLLELASDGGLATQQDVVSAAQWMLKDARARDRVDRFHAMWLGYYVLPHEPALTTAMRQETRALLDDVIFDNPRSYLDVFQAKGSYVNDTLADLYGLPAPGSDQPTWVDYGSTGRLGLLSHGSFLSVSPKFGDTSPTQRGLLIRTRLLCREKPESPADVDTDNPPTSPESNCKIDRYAEHASNGACRTCHQQFDPLGFGLEQYDQLGAFRTVEAEFPECEITAEGSVDAKPFSGPAGLADLLIEEGLLDSCMVSQIYRMAMGHAAGDDDMRYLEDLQTSFGVDEFRFDALVLSLVGDEAFLFRREET